MCQVIETKLRELWSEEAGVLSFEWVLLVTLLTFGIVSGLAAARDAIVDELGDVAEGMLALDGSYYIDLPLDITLDGVPVGRASDSRFQDFALFSDCSRAASPTGQAALTDGGS